MNLDEVETFLMIVKTRNITKTAEILFLSQPTVSHRLKMLEDELQLELVTRRKGYKSIELTKMGEEFVPIAQRWVSLWKEMQALQHNKGRMHLTMGCTDTLSSTIFSELYHTVVYENPQMDLRVKTHQSHEIYDLLERHDIDIGFVYHHLDYKNIVAKPILQEKMFLVQAAEGAIQKRHIFLSDMDPDYEIFFSWEADYQIWHDQWLGASVRPRIWVDTFWQLQELLRHERRWMIAPASVARKLQEICPICVSEIADKFQPPERLTYEIRHKSPNRVTLQAVDVFEKELELFLERGSKENSSMLPKLC